MKNGLIKPGLNKVSVGVSGDAGSFSEEAGLLYAHRTGFEPEIFYLTDMEGVLRALDKGEIELGIFPVVNSRGGLVQTAFAAMGRHLFEFIEELWMEVYQCLLVKPGVKKEGIKSIARPPQGISQCERYIRKEYPKAELVEWSDTAGAARDLSEGVLGSDTAVIASARTAEIYNLEILERGIHDNHPNLTTFIIVKKSL